MARIDKSIEIESGLVVPQTGVGMGVEIESDCPWLWGVVVG